MDKPQDDNGKCDDHPKGCRKVIENGTWCKFDAAECQLLKGRIWQVSVRRFDDKGNLGCKIGITRVLWYDLQLVGNRIGVLGDREKCPDHVLKAPGKLPATVQLHTHCFGVATLYFVDGGNHGMYTRPGPTKTEK